MYRRAVNSGALGRSERTSCAQDPPPDTTAARPPPPHLNLPRGISTMGVAQLVRPAPRLPG